MKAVHIIHRWEGNPKGDWYPWLKEQLVSRGYKVFVPEMPNPNSPNIEEWVGTLKKIVTNCDENTFFVGHSIGCQTILRYFETLPNDTQVGGVVFVAPWTTLAQEAVEGAEEIAKPWLTTPIDWEKVRKFTNNYITIFSDNDTFVELSNAEIFREKLHARVVIEKDKGHFTNEDNVETVQEVLDELLKLS